MKGHRGRMGNMWISGVPANALRHLGIHRQLAGGRESDKVCARHTHTHALHLSLSECHKLGTQPREIRVFVGLEHVYVCMRVKGNNLLQFRRERLQKPDGSQQTFLFFFCQTVWSAWSAHWKHLWHAQSNNMCTKYFIYFIFWCTHFRSVYKQSL